jgi:hypothetical protein
MAARKGLAAILRDARKSALLRVCEPLAAIAFGCTKANMMIPVRRDSLARDCDGERRIVRRFA